MDTHNNKLNLQLRKTEISDLEYLFHFQLNEEARYLAAFTSKDSTNKTAYVSKYNKLLNDPSVNNQTIIVDELIVGSIAKFVMNGETEITYWIDRDFWGRGITTLALKKFLAIETGRPIFARIAFDNLGSQKVLQNCGFIKIGTDKGFANERQKEIEEFIYKLS